MESLLPRSVPAASGHLQDEEELPIEAKGLMMEGAGSGDFFVPP